MAWAALYGDMAITNCFVEDACRVVNVTFLYPSGEEAAEPIRLPGIASITQVKRHLIDCFRRHPDIAEHNGWMSLLTFAGHEPEDNAFLMKYFPHNVTSEAPFTIVKQSAGLKIDQALCDPSEELKLSPNVAEATSHAAQARISPGVASFSYGRALMKSDKF